MQCLQKAEIIFTQKNGTQQTRKTPIMTPTVIAALWSLTYKWPQKCTTISSINKDKLWGQTSIYRRPKQSKSHYAIVYLTLLWTALTAIMPPNLADYESPTFVFITDIALVWTKSWRCTTNSEYTHKTPSGFFVQLLSNKILWNMWMQAERIRFCNALMFLKVYVTVSWK